MTAILLLSIPVRNRRDLLLARQRALQLGRLLRLPASEQIHLAAGTFAVASQALPAAQGCQLQFQVRQQTLHVVLCPEPSHETWLGQPQVQLVRPLPDPLPLDLHDVRFLLEKVPTDAALDSLTNLEQMNQEILALLHALRAGIQPMETTAPHLVQPAA